MRYCSAGFSRCGDPEAAPGRHYASSWPGRSQQERAARLRRVAIGPGPKGVFWAILGVFENL